MNKYGTKSAKRPLPRSVITAVYILVSAEMRKKGLPGECECDKWAKRPPVFPRTKFLKRELEGAHEETRRVGRVWWLRACVDSSYDSLPPVQWRPLPLKRNTR